MWKFNKNVMTFKYLITLPFTSFAAGTGTGTGTVSRCVQGPGRGELSSDAEQQEAGSPAHPGPDTATGRPGPRRVCPPRYLSVTEPRHQNRYQRNAIAVLSAPTSTESRCGCDRGWGSTVTSLLVRSGAAAGGENYLGPREVPVNPE